MKNNIVAKIKMNHRYILGFIATFLIIILFVIYILTFGHLSISKDHSDWAIFGTYIGGVSGALLTFITIWLLVFSLNLQDRHSTISQFESSFFELIRLHKEVTARIRGTVSPVRNDGNLKAPDGSTYTGLEYIEMVSKVIHHEIDGRYEQQHGEFLKKDVSNKMGSEKEQQENIDEIYDKVYKGKETTLGHYFRSLYHIIKFIDDGPIENKRKYADLVQAYLTDSELHILFYNGIGRHGRERLKQKSDNYLIFENIDSKGLFFEKHFETFYPKTYPSFKKKQEYKNQPKK